MNVEPFAAVEHDSFLESVASELTDIVYRVALRHGVGDHWLDLQLDLWEAFRRTLDKRSRLHETIDFEQQKSTLLQLARQLAAVSAARARRTIVGDCKVHSPEGPFHRSNQGESYERRSSENSRPQTKRQA
jgi:hypothetical protein